MILVSILTILGLSHLTATEVSGGGSFYMAAVLEHAPLGTRDDPDPRIGANLAVYQKAASVAKEQGVDILVFPEFGICRSGEREETKKCAEDIPDPKTGNYLPCDEHEVHADGSILKSLSCLAKDTSIVIVASMPDIKKCKGECDCPSDGFFLYNSNVVFDRNGKMLVRYHKEHLLNEPEFNLPKEPQRPLFQTDFGTFSTYTCYDLNFEAVNDISRQAKVDGVALPANWDDEVPFGISIQTFQARAMASNLTLMIADLNIPEIGSVGSGIFNGWEGPLAYTYNPDGVSKLVVAKVPKYGQALHSPESRIIALNAKSSWMWTKDGRDVPLSCSEGLVSKNDYKTSPCSLDDNHIFVPLKDPSGYVHTCNNGMCCSVSYVSNGLKEDFFLAIYNGTKSAPHAPDYCLESCGLTACRLDEDGICTEFPLKSETEFRSIRVIGNFSTNDIMPSVLQSGVRLLPQRKWTFGECPSSKDHVCLSFDDKDGKKILSAGLFGRCYSRDQPYLSPKCSNAISRIITNQMLLAITSSIGVIGYLVFHSYVP